MVIDSQTNFLYLADTLPTVYPNFYRQFISMVDSCDIPHALLPGTSDVWAVDYMPVQLESNRYVQFTYNPDYLQNDGYVNWQQTITDANNVCRHINIVPGNSEIVLDGGNVVRSNEKVILTDKVFRENPAHSKLSLTCELGKLFQTDKVIFIPEDPCDFAGHADGMIRFVNEDTVLLNRYSRRDSSDFQQRLRRAVLDARLCFIEVPYNPHGNVTDDEAIGIYINYLQMSKAIILPVYGMKEDDDAVRLLEEVFPGQAINTVKSNEIARQGGVLNCISWNILVG